MIIDAAPKLYLHISPRLVYNNSIFFKTPEEKKSMTETTLETTPQEPEAPSIDIWKTLSFSRNALISMALSMFLLSPLIQLFARFIGRSKISRHQYPDLVRYASAVNATHKIMIIAAVVLFLSFVAYAIYTHFNPELVPPEHRISLLSRETARRLVPYFLFVLFAFGIIVSTLIRGTNSWDMTGHWYMNESIFSYITYALAYFLCAILLWSDRARKILLYLLIGSALPIHLLALVNEWGTHISYFDAKGLGIAGVSAVFFNSNHYGYYIMITLLASALLFVYDRHIALRILSALCGISATMILILNNTLGAFLASLFVLILFLIYCLIMDRPHLKGAFLILGVFILITVVMSFRYNTIFSSLLVLSDDVAMIAENPMEADSAGSSRWRLWKGTVQHLPEHPLVGFGVEGLLSLYGIGTPHNEFLQYAAFFGIPVMLYYIAACFIVLWRIFRNHRQMSDSTMICFFVSIGYLASSFFGVTIFYTTPFFYILLGMTYAEYLKNGKKASIAGSESTGAETSDGRLQDLSLTEDMVSVDHPARSYTEAVAQARKQGLAEGLSRGREEGAQALLVTLVCRKLQKGKTAEEIANELEEDASRIKEICDVAGGIAPDYDVDLICRKLRSDGAEDESGR